jgi:hypothetical protein
MENALSPFHAEPAHRKRLGLEASLYQILQVLSVTLFEKMPILQALQASDSESDLRDFGNQLNLYGFQPDSSGTRSSQPFDNHP